MKSIVLVAALVLCAFAPIVRAQPSLTDVTIVVFNSDVPESIELARFYAEKRGIPRDHLVALRCSTEEEISREDYDRTIAGPLRVIFKKKKWWTESAPEKKGELPTVTSISIRFVALIKGMPLKIKPAEKYPGDKPQPGPLGNRNEASVDSELAVLNRFQPTISGAVMNPYFKSYRRIMEGPPLPILLVCRLDAPTTATVKQMIEDSIATEKTGLWGRAYVDAARKTEPGYEVGDEWMKEIVEQVRRAGIPVVYDREPEVIPDGFPVTDCALYYGWYAAGLAGPFAAPGFRFTPGAIAVHIFSFSASTLRDPNGGWTGPLLMRGAAASVGNVYEPYLELTNHLELLNDRLVHGFTFAESAYASIPALSWMSVMVGDPLYRPYGVWLDLDFKPDGSSVAAPYQMAHEFTLKNAALSGQEYEKAERAAASKADNGAMIEDMAVKAEQNQALESALSYYQQARTIYKGRGDILRVALEEAHCWVKLGQPKRALELIRKMSATVPEGASAALLRKLEQELDPTKATPTPKPKP